MRHLSCLSFVVLEFPHSGHAADFSPDPRQPPRSPSDPSSRDEVSLVMPPKELGRDEPEN